MLELEVVAVIRNIMGFCTYDLFQHALVKSLQRLDKAGLEIKEKQLQCEALSSVVRNKNDVRLLGYNNGNNNESPMSFEFE